MAIEEYCLQNNLKKLPTIKYEDDFTFYGSQHFIKNVLYNLLANAYKYGGPDVKVDIVTKGNILVFIDNGAGIDKEHIPYIFDKFYTQGKHGSTGIGLAFCKMVMEAIGGSITCDSEVGKYTKFILTFPRLII